MRTSAIIVRVTAASGIGGDSVWPAETEGKFDRDAHVQRHPYATSPLTQVSRYSHHRSLSAHHSPSRWCLR